MDGSRADRLCKDIWSHAMITRGSACVCLHKAQVLLYTQIGMICSYVVNNELF